MALRTDFFVTDLPGLKRAFIGWKRPTAERVPVEMTDPFTRERRTVQTWGPDPADVDIVEPLAGRTLGERLGSFPHLALRDVDPLKVADLMASVLGETPMTWLEHLTNPPPLVPDEPDGQLLAEIPRAFVTAARGWSASERREVGRKWAEAMAESTGDGWTADDCTNVLTELVSLATQADGDKRLFYWC